MSIFIKDMEMPKSCDTCFLSKWDTCNERFYCMFDDCPLVEVPAPHGNLIDTDALIKSFNEMEQTQIIKLIKSLIDLQPTVIEAEGRNDR